MRSRYLDAHEIAQAAEKSAVAGMCAQYVRNYSRSTGRMAEDAEDDVSHVIK